MRFLALFRDTRVALFTPAGEHCRWLSDGLSLLHLAVGPVTARKYVHALARLLAAGRADLNLVVELAKSEAARAPGCLPGKNRPTFVARRV